MRFTGPRPQQGQHHGTTPHQEREFSFLTTWTVGKWSILVFPACTHITTKRKKNTRCSNRGNWPTLEVSVVAGTKLPSATVIERGRAAKKGGDVHCRASRRWLSCPRQSYERGGTAPQTATTEPATRPRNVFLLAVISYARQRPYSRHETFLPRSVLGRPVTPCDRECPESKYLKQQGTTSRLREMTCLLRSGEDLFSYSICTHAHTSQLYSPPHSKIWNPASSSLC